MSLSTAHESSFAPLAPAAVAWQRATLILSTSGIARASLVLLASIATLLVAAVVVDIHELKARGLAFTLNDQIGYVTAARGLVETGVLRSHLIYPAVLAQTTDKSYLYMPGHYLALAVSYVLFGFGAIQSLLPSMAAYVVAAVALFFGTHKLYGREVATGAALLFVLFPANIAYALTAMAEMTVVAAAVVAFAIFVHLPFGLWRVAVGPLLLIPPLLVRETGIVVAIPFVLLILFGEGRPRLKAALVFTVLSTLVVLTMLLSDIAAGRPSLTLIELFSKDERFIYGDAFFLQHLQPQLLDWLRAPAEKFVFNARQLLILVAWTVRNIDHINSGVATLEVASLGLIVLGMPLAIAAIVRQPRHILAWGSLGVTVVLLVAILSLYFVLYYQAVRHLLLAVPFECIVGGMLLRRMRGRGIFARPIVGRHATVVSSVRFGLAALCALALTYAALRTADTERGAAARDLAFLEGTQHDDASLLVTPWQLPFEYVYKHYPVRWAFLPADPASLRLLNQTYPIGTLVLPADTDESDLMAADVQREGLEPIQTVTLGDAEYTVFRPVAAGLAR